MLHPRTYIFSLCFVRCLVLTLWSLCRASVPAAAEGSHMHFLLSTQPFLHPLVSEFLMRRLSFYHPKDCSPRAPQPALAGVKVRKGTAVPYFRFFLPLFYLLFSTSHFYSSCLLDVPCICRCIVQLRRKELSCNFNLIIL